MKSKLKNMLAWAIIPFTALQLGCATVKYNPVTTANKPAVTQPKKEWKVSAYLDGDAYNVDDYTFWNFNELEKVGSNEIIDIYAQLDRFYLTKNFGTRRYHVLKDEDMQKINSTQIGSDKELNMGLYRTFRDFVEWTETHDSKHHMLAINGHGFGIMIPLIDILDKRIEKPDSENRSLSNYVIDKAFDEKLKNKLEVILFESCEKASIETAYQLKDHAKVMVASENVIHLCVINRHDGTKGLLSGMEYDKILEHMVQNPSIDAENLGKFIIKSYFDVFQNNSPLPHPATLSAINLENIENFVEKFSKFSDTLIKRMEDEKTRYGTIKTLERALKGSQSYDSVSEFGECIHIDLFDFLKHINNYSDDKELKKNIKALKSSDIIIESRYKGESVKNSNGISILFMENFDNVEEFYHPTGFVAKEGVIAAIKDYYGRSEFAKKTRWDKVMELYQEYSPKNKIS